MMTTARGPVSWQQMARLQDEAAHGGYDSIWNMFEIPPQLQADQVLSRLAGIISRERALRIVESGRRGTQDGWVRYLDAIEPPVAQLACTSRADAVETARQLAIERFMRDGQPAWRFGLLSYPADCGRTALLGCVALDHFVSDGRSMHLLQLELAGLGETGTGKRHGNYREWVSGQRSRFPFYETRTDTAAQRFWRSHLDGTSADRQTVLPFSTIPEPAAPAQIRSLNFGQPLSIESIRREAARRGVTPFLLVLAAVTATVAQTSSADDITLRLISSGRVHRYLDNQGWFADSLPIRLCDARLTDFDRALAAVHQRWSQMLQFHDTPLGYIRAACAPIRPPVDEQPERRQLVVNFVPHEIGGMYPESVEENTADGDIDGLHLILLADQAGRCRLGAMFSPAHFATAGVRSFVADLTARLVAVTSSSEPDVPTNDGSSQLSC